MMPGLSCRVRSTVPIEVLSAAAISRIPAGCFRDRDLFRRGIADSSITARTVPTMPRPWDLPDELDQKKFLTPSDRLVLCFR